MEDNKNSIEENLIKMPCSMTIPGTIEVQEGILMDGNKYEYGIYTGCKPATLEEIPTGRLLWKGLWGKSAKIIADGRAGHFVIVRNDQEVAGYGSIGTSGGCPMTISNTSFVKGGLCRIG